MVVITHGIDEAVVKNLFTAITGVSARAKAQLVLTAAGLAVLGFALVAGLLLMFHERATAQFESSAVIHDLPNPKR